jgi:hypothetical protein
VGSIIFLLASLAVSWIYPMTPKMEMLTYLTSCLSQNMQEMVTTYREAQWLFVASCHRTTTQITVKKENVLPQKVTFVQK